MKTPDCLSLEIAIENALHTARFKFRGTGPHGTSEVRALFNATNQEDRFSWLRLLYPENTNDALEKELSNCLAPFLDSDGKIGFSLPYVIGGQLAPDIPQFTKRTIAAAALLGSERTASTITGWANGEPVRYSRVYTIRGIHLIEPFVFQDGVRFESITEESDKQAGDLFPLGADELIGPALVLQRIKPDVFFRHPGSRAGQIYEEGPLSGPREFDNLLRAVSLECSSRAIHVHSWTRQDEVVQLLNPSAGMSYREILEPGTSTTLTPQMLESVQETYRKLNKRNDLDIAIERWLNSLGAPNLDAKLIELRILLESLYTRGIKNELRFRVALHGAWHLQRRGIFDAFRDIYDHASTVIHGGEIKEDKEAIEALVEGGQEACRDAILKRLDEERDIDFKEKILDSLVPEQADI